MDFIVLSAAKDNGNVFDCVLNGNNVVEHLVRTERLQKRVCMTKRKKNFFYLNFYQ